MPNSALWVDAAPFRALLGHLVAQTGTSWRVIAALLQVRPSQLQHLLFGRRGRRLHRISPELAAGLIALDEATIAALRTQTVPAAPTVSRLRAWQAIGGSLAEIADWCGADPAGLAALTPDQRCTRLIALAARAAADRRDGFLQQAG